MKSQPCKLISGQGYVPCPIEDSTHLTINLPGPVGLLTLPVIRKGSRKEANAWSWNGDIEKPTLRPSVLNEGTSYGDRDPYVKENWIPYRCHVWVNDGMVIYLDDTTHELKGRTVPLFDINEKDLG